MTERSRGQRPDIQIVGHVCVDLTPELNGHPDTTPGVLTEVGPMRIRIGGAVGNGARVARGLGHVATLSGTVGDDSLGALCRTTLEDDHPGFVDLQSSATASTSYSVVVQEGSLDRSFWHHTGANDAFDGTCALHSARVLHFGYPTLVPAMTQESGQPTVSLFERAHLQGSITSLDLAYCAANSPLKSYDWSTFFRNVLPVTDVFCPSWDDVTSALGHTAADAPELVHEAARTFLEWGAGVVLITAGGAGAYLATGSLDRLTGVAKTLRGDASAWAGVSEWVAAAPVENFVSTNGAGDTFKVAFLLAALGATDVRTAAHQASVVVARHIGGHPLQGA